MADWLMDTRLAQRLTVDHAHQPRLAERNHVTLKRIFKKDECQKEERKKKMKRGRIAKGGENLGNSMEDLKDSFSSGRKGARMGCVKLLEEWRLMMGRED